MNCEEFAMAGLDLRQQVTRFTESAVQRAAREHLRTCARCSSLQASWADLQSELRVLGLESGATGARDEVEAKLLAQFRQNHRSKKLYSPQLVARWGLAAAAVLACTLGINHWRMTLVRPSENPGGGLNFTQSPRVTPAGPELGDSVVASNGESDFALVPGVIPASLDNAAIVRVEMPRAALGSLGFTVNEEHATDLIQVELLIGDDGQTQAVRMPEPGE